MSEKFDWAKYNNQYKKDHYSQIAIRVDFETATRWKAAAEDAGESMVTFIRKAMEARINELQTAEHRKFDE